MNTSFRRLQPHVINRKLKDKRVRQSDVAAICGVSTTYVCRTIYRRVKPSPRSEAVWTELERILGGAA